MVTAIPFEQTRPALDDAAVHLWRLDLVGGNDRQCWDCLDTEERARAERFRVDKARNAYVRTRGTLRVLLGHYLERDPARIALVSNSHGKPRLADTGEDRGLVFNLSHSEDRALLAFARDTALGVDLESLRPRHDLEGLAKICLSPEEMARWNTAAAEARLPEFIRLWVCKEAFVKAVGRGIGMGIKRAVVNARCDGFLDIPAEYGEPSEWRLKEWGFGDFRAAVVFRGAEREIRFLEG